jgi:Na+/melibiose symporter-like transporter
MKAPIISGFRQLEPAPRRFLFFVAVNVVSWQNIVGPAMVLFARKIDMPEFLVGVLISFMPFAQLLLLVTMPMVTRFGPKRVMLWAWFWRNVICCVVFAMPFALRAGDRRVAWMVLLVAILGFCVMRAVGSGGWLPWLHEIVPENRRSVYFSTETAVTQVINIAIMFVQAWLLAGSNPSVATFLIIYAIGIAMGFLSLVTMSRIHGGAPFEDRLSFRDEVRAYAGAYRDRAFLRFMLAATFCIASMSWFGSATVMYMRDILKLHDSMTMAISAAASVGVLLTIASWGRFAEHSGSGPAMFKSLTGHALAALLMLVLPLHGPWRAVGACAAMTLAAVFCSAWFVAVNRSMLNQTPGDGRIGYTAAWTVCTSMAFGVTPLLAGAVIERFGLPGFRACFTIATVSGFAGALLCLYVVPDANVSRPTVLSVMHPSALARTMGRIAAITLGLHESNRDEGRK